MKFLILGAGPTGLTLAHALLRRGLPPGELLVVEREAEAGGLCRSRLVDGHPLDIGGGHFLDTARAQVLDFLFAFMPEAEWNRFDRRATLRLRGARIDHPLEANLWQLDTASQVDFLESIARAGCVRGTPAPEGFADWIRWKLGDRIAEEYMLPYNRKLWSMDPNRLGTYWLHKLPDVSFRDTLRSCLEGRPCGTLPAHGSFFYPRRHGYGEVWRRMGEALGDRLVLGCPVTSVDLGTRTVNGAWSAETILNTVPWTLWPSFCDLPAEAMGALQALVHVPVDVTYVPETLDDPSHWVYLPDEAVPHHRLLLRSNFIPGARGHWTEANATRSRPTEGFRHRNTYAYPVNTLGKPEAVAAIQAWARTKGIVGAGRWGRWEHMNSDVAVAEALDLAQGLEV